MDTTTQPNVAAAAFQADDVDEVVAYRTLSALAIIGLLFGLASPLFFASRLFLLVPVVGVAISLLALRRIAASEGTLVGRAAAITGLVLCIACVAAVLSRDTVTRYLRSSQAEEFAQKWLMLVLAGETQPAFRQTYDGLRPAQPPPEPNAPPPPDPLKTFTDDAFYQAVHAAGADAKVAFVRTLSFEQPAVHQFLIRQQFTITPTKPAADASSSAHPVEVILTLQRLRIQGGQSRWLVRSYELPAADASTG